MSASCPGSVASPGCGCWLGPRMRRRWSRARGSMAPDDQQQGRASGHSGGHCPSQCGARPRLVDAAGQDEKSRDADRSTEFGYDRYAAHGGDNGSVISRHLGILDAEHVAALHLTALRSSSATPATADPDDPDDQASLAKAQRYQRELIGYALLQSTQGNKAHVDEALKSAIDLALPRYRPWVVAGMPTRPRVPAACRAWVLRRPPPRPAVSAPVLTYEHARDDDEADQRDARDQPQRHPDIEPTGHGRTLRRGAGAKHCARHRIPLHSDHSSLTVSTTARQASRTRGGTRWPNPGHICYFR